MEKNHGQRRRKLTMLKMNTRVYSTISKTS